MTRDGLPPYVPGRRLYPISPRMPASRASRATRFGQQFSPMSTRVVVELPVAVDFAAVAPGRADQFDLAAVLPGASAERVLHQA